MNSENKEETNTRINQRIICLKESARRTALRSVRRGGAQWHSAECYLAGERRIGRKPENHR